MTHGQSVKNRLIVSAVVPVPARRTTTTIARTGDAASCRRSTLSSVPSGTDVRTYVEDTRGKR